MGLAAGDDIWAQLIGVELLVLVVLLVGWFVVFGLDT